MSVQVGDKVMYLPDECHAFDLTPDNQRCWKFAVENFDFYSKKTIRTEISPDGATRLVQDGAKGLIKVAPAVGWAALVTNVHEDGSCDLEIHQICRNYNSILEYKGIKEDSTCIKGHTWHFPNKNSPRLVGDWPKGA